MILYVNHINVAPKSSFVEILVWFDGKLSKDDMRLLSH